ncbi:putative uncharacterized protein DDB_G0282499 [Colias croceus]|uniref:putative uncharacterized protein DDB_G0282499 n=1 Tax=Colias crocea TaxID=72248 RepID=UPI001E2819A8|nr:putative uncharacterized protein DDB_G0282499 [Colias croceus]XP_045510752.1 putative uncharacterized protein DDB_G0282499 [Colias croceus]XP_045510753.1 putative uncharacterized protein DDB_G0282499 [Colias croceus]
METPVLTILLICIGTSFASHSSYTIPVEGYETELHDLGEHVENHETPVRIIKITKTVAVKVPVPYPVKVVQKVPYPVHINRPYPVPVPQIIKVPHDVAPKLNHENHALDIEHRDGSFQNPHNSYQVQENHPQDDAPNPYEQDSHAYNGPSHNSYNPSVAEEYNGEGPGDHYNNIPNNYYESSDDQDGHNTLESKNYDIAIQNYLNNMNSNNNHGASRSYHH